MQSLILLLVVLLLVVVLTRGLAAPGGQGLGMLTRRIGGGALIAGAAYMAATGRILLAVPLGFLGLLLVGRRTPFSPAGSAQKSPGQVSRVRTAFLEMSLDHDSGRMSGHVIAGVFAGRELDSLASANLIVLWRECRAGDPQSRQLLEAYLDRTHPEWRDQLRGSERSRSGEDRSNGDGAAPPMERERGPMSRGEAFEVLGLAPTASPDEIRSAHRNLMKRLHPDQGGSNYLAAKINEAKSVLLAGQA